MGDETAVLHEHRIAQPQLFPERLPLRLRRVLPHHGEDGIADITEEGEGDQRHGQHDADGLEDSPDDVREQRETPLQHAAMARTVVPGPCGGDSA